MSRRFSPFHWPSLRHISSLASWSRRATRFAADAAFAPYWYAAFTLRFQLISFFLLRQIRPLLSPSDSFARYFPQDAETVIILFAAAYWSPICCSLFSPLLRFIDIAIDIDIDIHWYIDYIAIFTIDWHYYYCHYADARADLRCIDFRHIDTLAIRHYISPPAISYFHFRFFSDNAFQMPFYAIFLLPTLASYSWCW